MKIKYVISSYRTYTSITLPRLINSLLYNNIPKEDIFIAVGGEGNDYFVEKDGIEYKNVITNSFDLTVLIECCKYDLFPEYDYFFLLHDTCEVGSQFKKQVESFIKNDTITISLFSSYPSSNIGIYSRNHIMKNAHALFEIENKDKGHYVAYEDFLFLNKNNNAFSNAPVIDGYNTIYTDKTVREINKCPAIELTKYKANWYMRKDWIITA